MKIPARGDKIERLGLAMTKAGIFIYSYYISDVLHNSSDVIFIGKYSSIE